MGMNSASEATPVVPTQPERLSPANMAALSKAGLPIPTEPTNNLFKGVETQVDPNILTETHAPEVLEKHEKTQNVLMSALRRIGIKKG